MKKILAVAFFCLPAFGQAAYSGHGLNSVSAAYGASVCGAPDYAPPCSISDTAFLGLVNGGSDYVFLWNGTTAQLLLAATNGLISFPIGTVFSKSARDHVYTLDNTTGPGIYVQDNTVTLTQGSGAVTTSNLFDWTNSQCLMNTVNGYPTDPLRLATITSWSGSGSQVTFQAANIYVAGQTVSVTTTSAFTNASFTVLA